MQHRERLSPRDIAMSLDMSCRSLDAPLGPMPESAEGGAGEELVRDVYRRHAGAFFDDLRAWFTKEARTLRKAAERQLEGDQLAALRERVDQLENGTGAIRVPASAGDAAAGAVTSPRAVSSPSGRCGAEGIVALDANVRALCREEARSALEQLRGELLGGDLLCDELLSGGAGLRPALERLLSQVSADRECVLSAEVAELRASVDGAVAAATAAATAEIGQLDGAFRSSLAAEVRELGSVCEGVRARLEALDESAAEHIGRLSTRLSELEDPQREKASSQSAFCNRTAADSSNGSRLQHGISSAGEPATIWQPTPATKDTRPPDLKVPTFIPTDYCGMSATLGGDLANSTATAACGSTASGSSSSFERVRTSAQESDALHSKLGRGSTGDATVRLPAAVAQPNGLVSDDRALDPFVGPAGGETLPSTPPKRHVPPSTPQLVPRGDTGARTSPRGDTGAGTGSLKAQWSSCTSLQRTENCNGH